ncbi:hypothetical protein BDM02DRAFT_3120699 [Thelephora ganbajun]|uniref:Uncharacterized protein n=1 Tax=Thelephora ganbajun TaxID=370292 RepID=A0ACB6Z672_THEGA|nr:hypothetical protein BDM02DRAFT_3120699 [Thelephora ganbajun]
MSFGTQLVHACKGARGHLKRNLLVLFCFTVLSVGKSSTGSFSFGHRSAPEASRGAQMTCDSF